MKKQYQTFFLVLFALWLGGCGQSTDPANLPVNEGHRNSPLHVGDTWKYEITQSARVPEWVGQTLTLRITEMQEINGQSYFLFDCDFSPQVCSMDSGLFRVESQQVIRLYDSTEYVWYDFGAKPGERFSPDAEHWSVPSTFLLGRTAHVQISGIGDCLDFAGQNVTGDSCYAFEFFDAVDAVRFYVFAPDVGLIGVSISALGASMKYHIREAVIAGKQFEF